MREAMALVFAAGAAQLLGFALLALSQERHWCTVACAPVAARVPARWPAVLGVLLNVAALPLAITGDGAGFGSLLWGVMLSLAALAIALLLAFWPRSLAWLAQALRRR
jgi:Protein of unknown function (DUF3325)